MIKKANAKSYCKDDISKIENYDKAIADTTQTWVCHHRLALTLDREFAHTAAELDRLGMYYHRPYFELVFLTPEEHRMLHGTNCCDETRKKKSESLKGSNKFKVHLKKLHESNKGRTRSEETRHKISESLKGKPSHNKGKPMSDEQKRKISEANKARWANRKTKKS